MAERFRIVTLAPVGRLAFRGDATAAAALGLPDTPCRASTLEGGTALWLGPDEWLLVGTDGAAVSSRLAGLPHSLVEVSDRNLGIEIAGPAAERLLGCLILLDLDPAAFPVGMCTRTIAAKAEVVLWRQAPDRFRIEVWRSFAPYLLGLLAEAGRDPSI